MDHEQQLEYDRLTRELHGGLRAHSPRRTFRQVMKDEWIAVLVVLAIVGVPMLLAVKGAIF